MVDEQKTGKKNPKQQQHKTKTIREVNSIVKEFQNCDTRSELLQSLNMQ